LKNTVLDSYAVLAFLFGEKGADMVAGLFEEAAETDHPLIICAPNWTEVGYISERKVGRKQWNQARIQLLSLPLEVAPADQELAEIAAEIKAKNRLSLGDAFAAALAKKKEASLYTGDPEFKAVENEVAVVWL
jgi:uncharacterized protein